PPSEARSKSSIAGSGPVARARAAQQIEPARAADRPRPSHATGATAVGIRFNGRPTHGGATERTPFDQLCRAPWPPAGERASGRPSGSGHEALVGHPRQTVAPRVAAHPLCVWILRHLIPDL